MDPAVVAGLRDLGHDVQVVSGYRRAVFGLGQIIAPGLEGILWSGSDSRGDGHAAGY
jgi:gamma-glutamyltranspeptidase/glutathione hydrolase